MRNPGEPRPHDLLRKLAEAGARVQRELFREEVLRRSCESLGALGLRCAELSPAEGGVRIASACLGQHQEPIERAIGAPVVGLVRATTPFLDDVWQQGGAYTDRFPEEVARFVGVPVEGLLREIGNGAFTRAIGVRVVEAGAPGLMIFATGAWLREEHLGAFRLFAAQLGAALDAARTVTGLRERAAELAALNRLATLASAAEDLGPMLDAASEVVREVVDADAAGVVVLPVVSGKRLVHASGSVAGALAAGMRAFSEEEPIFQEVMREGVVRVGYAEDIPPTLERYWTEGGFGTFAAVPLRFRGAALGVMVVVFCDRRPPEGCHVDLLGAMGGQLAGSIANHNLLDRLLRRISELTLLNDIAAATVVLDPRLLLDSAFRRVAATFGADAGIAYLEEPTGRSVVGQFGYERPLESAPPVTRRDLTALAIERKVALRWPQDVPDTTRSRWFRDHEGMQVAVAVPILAKDRSFGCFLLARRSSDPFTEEDLRLMSAVGVQLGVAVDNARLYEDLRRSYAALRKAQEQLIQQERLAALGELAAVIAHEVRNPLGVIFNSLGALARMVPPGGDPKMLLDMMGEEADRLNRMVSDLLDFARPAPAALRAEPIDRVIEDAVQSAGIGSHVGVVRDVAPDLPPVPMDARLIRQVLLNLVANAVQAMPRGGTLTLAARLDGDSVRIDVADTGPGIPEELRQRVFEPFYTTRPTGTGLGLAVVKRILDDHGATIRVEPVEPTGARFVIHLALALSGTAQDATVERPRPGE